MGFRNYITGVKSMLIMIGLMIATSLVLVSCSRKNPIEPTDTKDNSYFPLSVGNNWLYGWEDSFYGDNFSWTIVQMNGDTALVERPYADGPQFVPITVIQEGTDYLIKTATSTYELYYRFIPDSTWTHRRPYECDDYLIFKAVLDTTTIVTPAGSFSNCLKIVRQSTSNCVDAGIAVEWWAPGVGLVKWEEINFYAGVLTGYLISYHLIDR